MRHPFRGIVDRRIDAFLADPSSPRNAARAIIIITTLTVLLSSLVIWVFDPEESFTDYGTALWFALQTVTTVGYGDVTPDTNVGRFVAGIVMIVAIAFTTVITALVTSTFVTAAQSRRQREDTADEHEANRRVHERFDEISERMAAIERHLAINQPSSGTDSTVAEPSNRIPPATDDPEPSP